jgi:hypothetical protein
MYLSKLPVKRYFSKEQLFLIFQKMCVLYVLVCAIALFGYDNKYIQIKQLHTHKYI